MKQSKIVLPEAPEWSQQNLFPPVGMNLRADYDPFPPTSDIRRVVASAQDAFGVDFEFNPKTMRPSITGVASTAPLMASARWDINDARYIVDECRRRGLKIVGHNSIPTERVLLEENLGEKLPLELFEDSMISHYLLNQDWTKDTTKDEGDEGSLGFMNLWAMASVTTDLPVWKSCRGKACYGPCPRHDVFNYCCTDAFASVEAHRVMMADMTKHKIPYTFYRELIELAEICHLMEARGLRCNLPYIDKLNADMDRAKDDLFPFETVGKKTREYKDFNPRSADQIIDWFKPHGIHFKATEKKNIQAALEKQGMKSGHTDFKEYLDYLDEKLPESAPLKQLHALYQFKSSGKGCDPWMGEKYRTGDMVHPRFIVTATCTGRMASSRPNFQNIPARGWGKAIKTAVIPHDESLEFLEVDASQLELRVVLYLSGLDPSIIGTDAFTWLLSKGEGKFEKAVQYMPTFTPRDVVKTVAYGSLYGEGLRLLSGNDLASARVKREIFDGCLRVYDDWEFRGKKVAFTGANLAERFFGSKTDANRKKALEIQEDIYFAQFPILRKFHRDALAQIEDGGEIHSPTGRFLRLYGEDDKDAKMAFSFLGQGCAADHIQAIMLVYKREMSIIPDLMVHDSLMFSIPKTWSDKQALDFLQPMFSTTFRFPNLSTPGKSKRGPNYGTLRVINEA